MSDTDKHDMLEKGFSERNSCLIKSLAFSEVANKCVNKGSLVDREFLNFQNKFEQSSGFILAKLAAQPCWVLCYLACL